MLFDLDPDNPSESAIYTKAQQIKAYEASKTRVGESLLAANREKTNFGVRQEYRITLLLFRRLSLNLDVTVHNLWWSAPAEPEGSPAVGLSSA